jgi:hypothetical protein
MSGKTNWNRERDRRRAEQRGTASAYRGGPATRPKATRDPDRESSGRIEPDALWTFMREMARCEIEGLPTPIAPREVLGRIGVTSQSVGARLDPPQQCV